MTAPAIARERATPDAHSAHGAQSVPERNLDVLRAIAVLLVVFCHLFGVAPRTRSMQLPHEMGSTGVLIFFVHTSLVLMVSMQRMKRSGIASFAGRFYVRRLFRIYPLSIVTVVLAFLLHVPEHALAVFQSPTRLEWVANLLLVQNLARTRSAISPLWSLPWEVQMYLVLPFIFVVLGRLRHRAAIVLLASTLAALLYLSNWQIVLKLLEFTPCFLGGVLAYVLLRSKGRFPATAWPIFLLTLLAGYLVYRSWHHEGDYAAWVMCTVLGIVIPQFRDLPDGWMTRTAHLVAKYSYGIYLGHVPMIWLAFTHFARLPLVASCAIFLFGTTGLVVAAYHLIEAPMIGAGRRLSQ